MGLTKIKCVVVLASWLLAAVSGAWGQIRIGQTAGVSGAVAASVGETVQGARLHIDQVNAAGGVNGQKIELITLDDKFDPKLAAENARKLIVEQKVVALFLNRGTPHTEAILPLLAQHRVPLVAPSTGAMLLHQPVNPLVFNVRTTYQREAERAVLHFNSVGISRIGVVQVKDSFGADSAAGAVKGFAAIGKQPVFITLFDRAKPDYAELLRETQAKNPQALLFIGSGTAVADGVKALRTAGHKQPVITLSNNASGGFVQQLGDHARGVIVTQVFPPERNTSVRLVRELNELAQAKGLKGATPAMMEGYAGAKVLVEALRRAGKDPTPARIVAALDGMNRFDLGGVELGFAPDDHSGMNYVDISIIDSNGQFMR
jgi:ABC-type branched-subunit amino acid transport system substrate-binding protein